MNKYVLITDTTCDLNIEIVNKYDLKVIGMPIDLDEKTFFHNLDYKEMDVKTFYKMLRSGSVAKTTQINPQTFIDYFKEELEMGHDILYISFSSGLSGTYASSLIAIDILKQDYPERKIISIDSLCASAGEGLLVYYAALNKEKGLSIEENQQWLENNKLNLIHLFTVDDLFFLKRGGRISSTTAIVGSALKVKPLMHVDDEGHLIKYKTAHGRKQSLTDLVLKMKETIINPENQTIFIACADCDEDEEYIINQINKLCPVSNIVTSSIGPVIGAHSGPGTVALYFIGNKR